MAQKPLRPCAHAGCPALTRDGYCDKHRPKDRARRNPESLAWRGWYKLPIWVSVLRPEQLIREPFCRECARRGLRVPASDVDHIVPHRGDWDLFTAAENLQSLCHSCHSRKTLLEMHENAQAKKR